MIWLVLLLPQQVPVGLDGLPQQRRRNDASSNYVVQSTFIGRPSLVIPIYTQRSRNALHYFSFNMVPPKTRKSIALANQVGNSLYWAARCRGWLPYNFQHVRRRTQRTQCFIGYQEIRRSNTNHHILGHLPWWRESNQVDATRQVWGKPQRTQPARFAFLVYKTEASVSDRETLFCF